MNTSVSRVGIALLLLCTAGCIYNRFRYKRSLLASITEALLFIVKSRREKNETRPESERLAAQPDLPYRPDAYVCRHFTEAHISDMPVYRIGTAHTAPLVIYLHGGSYVSQIIGFQWRMVADIARRADCEIIVPIYPLAPRHTCDDSFRMLRALCVSIHERFPDRPMIFMGDSAGGGLALALAQDLHASVDTVPDALILLSPWVQARVDEDAVRMYGKYDPMLRAPTLTADAEAWAGDRSIDDPRISPINGCFDGIRNVTLFAGTHEIFYPDITRLHEKLLSLKIESRLFTGSGLNHVYPAYPIPEGAHARRQIAEIIRGIGTHP